MIDLNTILNTALTQAINEALKPLLERIATIESSVQHLDVWSTSTGNVMTDRLNAVETRVLTTTDNVGLQAICNRLDALEASINVEDLEETIDARISEYIENNDLSEFVDASNLDWSGIDNHIDEKVEERVRELICAAQISL